MNDRFSFRLVDASSVEATVLSDAEKRIRTATFPSFGDTDTLGFGDSSLRDFCISADATILGMASEVTRLEGQTLRERGITNLAARDRVQMKEQILKGLLRIRSAQDILVEMDNSPRAAAGPRANFTPTNFANESSPPFDDELNRREDLIKMGAVTPLDDLGSDLPPGALPRDRRMTLMDHKIAEGMKVKLPRSRHPRVNIMKQAATKDVSEGRAQNRVVDDDDIGSFDISVDIGSDRKEGEDEDNSRTPGSNISRTDASSAASRDGKHDKRKEGARGASYNQCNGCISEGATNRRFEVVSRSRQGATDKKRVKQSSNETGASLDKLDVELKVIDGGQPLVDDYSDADFEARKEQYMDAEVANCESDNSSAPNFSDFGDGLKMKGAIAQKLFQFQLTGVRWMWQLHRQGAGGIVGDEMGLGKTVQVSAFLGALYDSNVMRRALVLCPATVLCHWMAELHKWAPQLRVVILHRCAHAFNATNGNSGKIRALLRRVFSWSNVVVVTSYEGLRSLKMLLLPCDWDYGILDEGQRIRNPDAEVTLICKQIRTVHRLVLTGTPIQNNLRELWSLFDFVFPGRLGTLPAFEAEFSSPIKVGGYANASPMQARLAYRCALVLRDLIHPYLLRRQKKDLEEIIRLPPKTEQVLFCRLTSYQRRLYGEFLESAEVKYVLRRRMRAFKAIAILRKLCNHPDLVCNIGDSLVSRLEAQNVWGGTSDQSENDAEDTAERPEFGAAQRSGKLLVLQQILPLWHKQGHRVLLFSQTRRMLNIIESFVKDMTFSFGRLDGNTPVSARQTLINRFNSDESIFIMLLTTRTGGVGINLTGADRVILFDPDWNPSTDTQARERSWRVGQVRQVTVYRLITAGTIEEKIYHRQIFKTALTNRVLQDPKQKRIFSADELGDLFKLGDDGSLDGFNDTVDLFEGEGKVEVPDRTPQSNSGSLHEKKHRSSRKRSRKHRRQDALPQVAHSSDEPSSSPSALVGTATVALEPASGSNAESSVEPNATIPISDKSKNDDSAVLQALYDGAPLSSVFLHDIAEGSGVSTVEQKRMEEAAKRAAQRALNQLRMSRRTLRAGAGQGGFQSSWTGRNGGSSPDNSSLGYRNAIDASQAGTGRRFGTITNPYSTPREPGILNSGSSAQSRSFFDSKKGDLVSEQGSSGGVSSQEILRQIRSRNRSHQSPSAGLLPELQDSSASENKDAYYASLLGRLQDFLAQASSGVDTAALIHTFGNVRPADAPVFKQLLQAIAVCNNGEWTLRSARSD